MVTAAGPWVVPFMSMATEGRRLDVFTGVAEESTWAERRARVSVLRLGMLAEFEEQQGGL